MSPFFPSDMKLQENSLPDDDVPPSPSKGVVSTDIGPAQNLHHALWTLGPHCSEEEVFDSIWRLVMYLRYWKGGSDRTWIKDPRVVRRKASGLNWYQCLVRKDPRDPNSILLTLDIPCDLSQGP